MRLRSRIILGLLGLAIVAPAGWFGMAVLRARPLAEARRALDSGQFQIAAQLAEARLNAGGSDERQAMLLAARAYARMGKWPEAEAYFAQIPLADPEDLRLRARGLESRRLWVEAAMIYEQIIQRQRYDGDALQHLAAIRVQQDRTQEGLILARRLQQVPSYEVVGHVLTGMLEHQMRNHARAVEEFEAALHLSPELKGVPTERWQVLEWLAQALIYLGRAAEAEQFALEVRDQSSGPLPCYLLGQARQQQGDEDGALDYWKEALARDSQYSSAIIEIAQLHLRRGDPQEALNWALRARELAPDDSTIKYLLSTIYKRLGQKEKAEEVMNTKSP